jgi:PelA/Pel-15E family pectate lyase
MNHRLLPSAFIGLAVFSMGSSMLLAAGGGAAAYLKKPDAWFSSPDAKRVGEVILSYQSDLGGWPKNTDTVDDLYKGDRKELHPTFDNGATTDELRFLAHAYGATHEDIYQKSFLKGLGYILTAQYPTGGWPQFYPPSKQYHRHITFNDGAMTRLLQFLREVNQSSLYSFVPVSDRKAAGAAFEKGIQCILKCQIKVNGKRTVWCAQHDEIDFSPRPARAFELASFSGSESVGIVRLLMSLEKPSAEVIEAVDGAVAWFQSAKIVGARLERMPDSRGPKGNLVVTHDPAAPPVWARFYDLKTQKPLFSDRDGVPKSTIAEIGYERRNNYGWYGNWPESLIDKDYPAWKKRVGK